MRRNFGLVALLALIISAFAAPARAASASLIINPTSISQDDTVSLTLSGFTPKEIVSFWLTLPDYSVESSGDLVADVDGAVSGYMYISVGMPVGTYSLSARGNSSGMLATAQMEVKAAVGVPASSGVAIDVEQRTLPQGDCFYFTGAGYARYYVAGVARPSTLVGS
ncbi:hypothetical protein EKD04_023845 [Chloroflexales bacterium ZM16-3]|nr:hypothetical protein [Chloroflexales bacterium ZM16-3]